MSNKNNYTKFLAVVKILNIICLKCTTLTTIKRTSCFILNINLITAIIFYDCEKLYPVQRQVMQSLLHKSALLYISS